MFGNGLSYNFESYCNCPTLQRECSGAVLFGGTHFPGTRGFRDVRQLQAVHRPEEEIIVEKYGVNQLRKMFLDFMESKGHLAMKSFSLVPHNDNSLLLINAGMAPLKPYFTGA